MANGPGLNRDGAAAAGGGGGADMRDKEAAFVAFRGDLTIQPFGLKLRVVEDSPRAESGTVCLRPRVGGPPVHTHTAQDEWFRVCLGRLSVFAGRSWHDLEAGQSVEVPRGTPHTYRNASDEVCVFEYRMTPGGGFTRMMREFASLADRGKLRGPRTPSSLFYLAMVLVRHADEVRSISPPMFVMRTLAWLGRRFGCRL